MSPIGAHAPLLTARTGGLLSARALADFDDTVAVMKRGERPDTADASDRPSTRSTHLVVGPSTP